MGIYISIRPVRIQAFKTADTFLKRLETLVESMVNASILFKKISHIYKNRFVILFIARHGNT